MSYAQSHIPEGINLRSVGRYLVTVIMFCIAFVISVALLVTQSGPSLESILFLILVCGNVLALVHYGLKHYSL